MMAKILLLHGEVLQCYSSPSTVNLLKFTDDPALTGLISGGDEDPHWHGPLPRPPIDVILTYSVHICLNELH